MNDEQPVFGDIEPDRQHERRPSAYAVVTNDDERIAVVRTPRGYYLPGGGLKKGEDAEIALMRECLEECGFRPERLSYFASAVQLLCAPGEGCFRIEGRFYSAHLANAYRVSIQDGFEWMTPFEACRLLTRPFERWAIEVWMRQS